MLALSSSLVIFRDEKRLRWNGKLNAGAAQGEIDSLAHDRIGRVCQRKISEPVARGIVYVTVFEINRQTVRRWVARHIFNRLRAQGCLDSRDYVRRRETEVNIEIDPLAMLAQRTRAATKQEHLSFHQHTVRDDDRVPVARLNRSLPPANLDDSSLLLVDSNLVADTYRTLHLQSHPAHHVPQRIL